MKMKWLKFFWQIISAHTIAYFFAGIFAVFVMDYRELFSKEVISSYMHAVDEPIVALGPFLQIFRGILIACILLPLRKTFFEEKYGLVKLGLIIFGFSYLSTIGPTMGSFEGFIYTKVSYQYQLLGYPEAILYVLMLTGLLYIFQKYESKKIVTILSIVMMLLICFMSTMGFLTAKYAILN